jgi:ribosomal protein L17
MKKILIDTTKADVKVVYDSEADDVIIIAVIPSSIEDAKTAVSTIEGWITYAKTVKAHPSRKALEVLEVLEDIQPESSIESSIESIKEVIPYTPISQADDMPSWYVIPEEPLKVIWNKYNSSIERAVEGSKKKGIQTIYPTAVHTDFLVDEEDALGLLPNADEWESLYKDYWESMKSLLPINPKPSTRSDAWAIGDGPDRYQALDLCRNYISSNGINPKEGWEKMSIKEILDYLDELKRDSSTPKTQKKIIPPKRKGY